MLQHDVARLVSDFRKEVEICVGIEPHPNLVRFFGYTTAPKLSIVQARPLCVARPWEDREHHRRRIPTPPPRLA